VEGAPTFFHLVRFLSTTRPCRLNPSADRSHVLRVGSPPGWTRGEQKFASGDRMGVSRLRPPLDLGATYAGTGTTPCPSLFLLNTQLEDPTGGFTTEFQPGRARIGSGASVGGPARGAVEGAQTFSRLLSFLSTTRPCRLNPSANRLHMLRVGSPPSCTRGKQKLAAGERMGVSRSAELWREPKLFCAS